MCENEDCPQSSSRSDIPVVPMRMVPRVNWPHVVNLGNSIIGVSILTMPFCFQQCGIILGTLLLLFCTWLTLISCQLLMKAGITSRRKSFEFLAYHILGGGGKFVVEFLLIGLQLGTMIAQIVVIGDLGPSIVSKFTGLENTSTLRSGLIICLCLCVGLPLGLLKNVRSLSHTSTMCVCFYTIFVVYMILLSLPNLWRNDWVVQVRYWRWDGFFQCIPIFSLAFGCQTQLFLLYDELPEPSFNVINKIVSSAVNICSVAYLLVGFFGYIAFCNIEITGDIINMLVPTFFTDMIKLSFVLSIAVTFPLIIFPCRTSLYTMLFPKRPKTSDGFEVGHQIPELHFTLITMAIIIVSMVIGISVPNVEFILGLNGATMGTLICYIMPALFFLRVMSAASEGKGLSKFVLVVGVFILLTSTYTTLNSQDKSHHVEHQQEKRMKDNIAPKDAVQDILEGAKRAQAAEDHVAVLDNLNHHGDGVEAVLGDGLAEPAKDKNKDKESHRHEPPIPKPPDDIQEQDESVEHVEPVHNKDPVPSDRKPTVTAVKKPDKGKDSAGAGVGGGGKELSKDSEKKQAELLHKLEEQQQEQKKILEEQRQLLKELKKHREEEHKEKPVGGAEDIVAGKLAIDDRKFVQQQQQPPQPVHNVAQQQQAAQNLVQQQQAAQNLAQQQKQQQAAQNLVQQQQQKQQQAAQNLVQQQQAAQNLAQQQKQQQAAQNLVQQQQQKQQQAAQNLVQQQQAAQQKQQAAQNLVQQQQQEQQQAAQNLVQQQQAAQNLAQQRQEQQQAAQNLVQQQPVHNVAQQQQQQPLHNVAQQQQPPQPVHNVAQQQQAAEGVHNVPQQDAQKLPLLAVERLPAKVGHQNKDDSFIQLEKLDIAKQKLQVDMNNIVRVPVEGK